MTLGFRAKIFVASLGVAAAALAFLTLIVASERRQDERSSIEMRLVSQAQLIAELLSRNPAVATDQDIDDEADRLSQLMGARVTLIAADGKVLGDSDLEGQALADVENHLQRPEVQDARARGVGVVARYSTTVRIEMLYAAVTARHPRVQYVRVALPLTTVAPSGPPTRPSAKRGSTSSAGLCWRRPGGEASTARSCAPGGTAQSSAGHPRWWPASSSGRR